MNLQAILPRRGGSHQAPPTQLDSALCSRSSQPLKPPDGGDGEDGRVGRQLRSFLAGASVRASSRAAEDYETHRLRPSWYSHTLPLCCSTGLVGLAWAVSSLRAAARTFALSFCGGRASRYATMVFHPCSLCRPWRIFSMWH